MHKAAISGNEAVAELLIEQGAQVNARDKRGQTALDRAEKSGHEAVVALLLARGGRSGSQSGGGSSLNLWEPEFASCPVCSGSIAFVAGASGNPLVR